MSRQLVRQRPPAEDDLQPAVEEEMHKLALAAVGTTRQTPAAPQAGPQMTERSAYFSGQYAPVAAEMTIARRLAMLGVPHFLRHCVLDLIHVLRERGLGAALAAMHDDPTLDRRFADPVRNLLAAIDREERSSPT
jgi:hypothetical protein